MGFLRDLLRKYQGSAGYHSLEDFVETEAEKHLRSWLKNGCLATCEEYAQQIQETNLRFLAKADQISLAQEYFTTTGSIADDFATFGLDLAVELAAQVKVDEIISYHFLEQARAGLAIKEILLKDYSKVEMRHQNPYRSLSPLSVTDRNDMSVYEYLLEDGTLVDVYVNDYPYLAFVAQKTCC
jgi:hypothetical protein